ncbi:MAG: M15 family metallopeptidase [Actinomycetota bacterium]|nr:M15 family metallopeptidase [Actinomycetota bacterium]
MMVSSRVIALGSFAAAVVTLVASVTLLVFESVGTVGGAEEMAKRPGEALSLTALSRNGATDEATGPSSPGSDAPATADADADTDTDTDEVVVTPPFSGDLTVAWTSGGLTEGLAFGIASEPMVNGSTVVRGDPARLTGSRSADGTVVDAPAAGWYIPLDAFAVDPEMYAAVVPGATEIDDALARGDGAVLSETSARLRGLGPGGVLRLDDHRVEVRLVVPDVVVGGAEVVVSHDTGQRIGITTDRSVLFRHDIERSDLDGVVRAHVRDGLPVRVRSTGETAYLRYADNVIPQIEVKTRFGEFAVRPTGGRDVEIEPAWMAANVVDVQLPVVGASRCHRLVVDTLTSALAEVARQEALLAEPAIAAAEAARDAAMASRDEVLATREAAAQSYRDAVATGDGDAAARAVLAYEQADAALAAANTALAEAEAAVVEAAAPRLVDPAQYAGCQVSRLISEGNAPSRHAWGIAVDLNVASNPLGGASTQHQTLVAIMANAGFGWGGEWLSPDPMHFEYRSPPGG